MGISSDYMSIIWINMKKLVRTEKHDCTESMMFCVRGIIPNWAALGDSYPICFPSFLGEVLKKVQQA